MNDFGWSEFPPPPGAAPPMLTERPWPGATPESMYAAGRPVDTPVVDPGDSVAFDAAAYDAALAQVPQQPMMPQPAQRPLLSGATPARAPADPAAQGSNVLGLVVVAGSAGAAAGAHFAGPWGALAGLLYGGALVNAGVAGRDVLRGDPVADREAAIRGTFAVVGAAIATFILYKTQGDDDEEKAK